MYIFMVIKMFKLIELLNESRASDEAKKLGLDYMSFGRYGKNDKVTHTSQGDKLVPVDKQTSDSPRRQYAGGQDTEVPLKKIGPDGPGVDPYTGQQSRSPNVNKLSSMMPDNEPYDMLSMPDANDPDTAYDMLGERMYPKEIANFIKPFLNNPEQSIQFFNDMIHRANNELDDAQGSGDPNVHTNADRVIKNAASAIEVIKYINKMID